MTTKRIIQAADIVAARERIKADEAAGRQHHFEDALLGLPGVTPAMVREWLDAEPRVHWCACEDTDQSLIVCPQCGLPPYWAEEARNG
jgi:hypothetical protein